MLQMLCHLYANIAPSCEGKSIILAMTERLDRIILQAVIGSFPREVKMVPAQDNEKNIQSTLRSFPLPGTTLYAVLFKPEFRQAFHSKLGPTNFHERMDTCR